MPRNTSLNCTIPALVKRSVGSFAGTSGELGTCVCPFDTKYSMNLRRIAETFIRGAWQPCIRPPNLPKEVKTLDFNANDAFRPIRVDAIRQLQMVRGTSSVEMNRGSTEAHQTDRPSACS